MRIPTLKAAVKERENQSKLYAPRHYLQNKAKQNNRLKELHSVFYLRLTYIR